MVVAEFKVIPIVEGSMRPFIEAAVREIKKSNLKYEVDAMCTVIEGELSEVMKVVQQAHQAVLAMGANRVLTELSIDERKDGVSMESKVRGF